MSNTSAPSIREEVYDWLRGLASIAVVLGHFKPFGLPKIYLVWSVHAFVLVTLALAARRNLDFKKIIRALSYVAFVYVALVVTFRPLFLLSPNFPDPGLGPLFLHVRTVFIENPYFAHLWYILIYFQILIFLLFALPLLKRISAAMAIAVALVISQAVFWVTHYLLKSAESTLLPSWFFVMAVGYYIMPRMMEKIRSAESGRVLRCLAVFTVLGFIYAHPYFKELLGVSKNRVFVLNTAISFLVVYFLAEIYFVFKKINLLKRPMQFVFFASRCTLILYIGHQGVEKLFVAHGWGDPVVLTVFSLTVGLLYCNWTHHLFFVFEKQLNRWNFFPGFSQVKIQESAPQVRRLILSEAEMEIVLSREVDLENDLSNTLNLKHPESHLK